MDTANVMRQPQSIGHIIWVILRNKHSRWTTMLFDHSVHKPYHSQNRRRENAFMSIYSTSPELFHVSFLTARDETFTNTSTYLANNCVAAVLIDHYAPSAITYAVSAKGCWRTSSNKRLSLP
ncbi:hypothetical protein E4T56_gene10905 [Termitomyces sp. T112]|nr:hypothetical protein E4T56_gene10905 [Termitomyces sp. T112]